MATREEIKAASIVIETWSGIVDVDYLARLVLEAAEAVRSRPAHHEPDWTHPLIREDRPE